MSTPSSISPLPSNALSPSMTVEEARKVNWQGGGPRAPIGPLLDAGTLTHKDLAWAVEHAYSMRVREAARTLLLDWLGQSETVASIRHRGPVVLTGSHYPEEMELEKWGLLNGYIGFGLGIAIAVLALVVGWFFAILIPRWAQGQGATAILQMGLQLLFVAGTGVYFYRHMHKTLADYRAYRNGRRGEYAVLEKLRTSLDQRWTIFHNWQLPGRKDDLDLMLVGPGGVWLLEVKAYTGTVRARGSNWEYQSTRGWRTLQENPSVQVRQRAAALNDYLQRQGVVRWIEPAVVLSEPQPISNFSDTDVPVWTLPETADKAESLSTRNPPDEPEIARIVAAIKSARENRHRD